MAKRKKRWVYVPPRKAKPKVSEALKAELTEKVNTLIENKLKPWKLDFDSFSKERGWNYAVDMYTKWWRNYLYLCSKYRSPGPNAISEYFEIRFTRLEYIGGRQFNLAYMRHTGQWWEVYHDISLEESLKKIANEQTFWP